MGSKSGGQSGQQAAAQDWANTQEGWQKSTAANRPDMTTPWGKQTWTQDGDKWSSAITLTPEEQASLDSQQRVTMGRSQAAEGLVGQATDAFNKPFDWESMPDRQSLESVGYDPVNARKNAEDALYQKQMSRLDPELSRSEDARRARMANMGFALEGGSQGFERAQESMDKNRQRATQDAAWNSIIGGGNEASQELARATGAAGFGNTNRQAAIAEEAQRRGMPLNELNALLTGQQVSMPDQPDFKAANAMGKSDFVGGAGVDAGNQNDWGSAIGGVANLAGTAAKAYYTGGASLAMGK